MVDNKKYTENLMKIKTEVQGLYTSNTTKGVIRNRLLSLVISEEIKTT